MSGNQRAENAKEVHLENDPRREKSLLYYGAQALQWGAAIGALCLLGFPVVLDPATFQAEAGLLPVIVETPSLLWIHMAMITAFVLLVTGMMVTAGICGGLVPHPFSDRAPDPRAQFMAIATVTVSLIGCTVGCLFMMVDGFALAEMSHRWVGAGTHELDTIYRSAEAVMAIAQALFVGTNIFLAGLSPLLIGLGLRSVGGRLTSVATANIVVGILNIVMGLGYAQLFFTDTISLSEGSASMRPYMIYTTLNFVCIELNFMAVFWTGTVLRRGNA
jgi:hypothetical protein